MEQHSGLEFMEKHQHVTERVGINPDPIKAVSHYFKTKFEKSLLVRKKPDWDVPRLSPATELVTAKRDLMAAEKLLERKRQEQTANRELMDKEWKDLLQKELNLRDAFLKFNKFVKENHEKRERAEQKIKEEKELQKGLDREIDELQDKVNYMKSIKDEMERHVEDHKIYENFLVQVIEVSSEIHSTQEILNRYETLTSARTELAARQERDLSALESARTEMIKLTEEKSQMMMGLNNELAQLQIRYDRAKAMSLRWETALSRIKNISAEKALELDQVRISCWNLYTSMCIRKNIEITIEPDNIEEQLVFIKRSIQELKRILRLVQRKAAKDVSSTIP